MNAESSDTPIKTDVLIIGSGPAGLTAGIYTGRAALKSIVLAGIEFGGQLMNTTMVENFPGYPDGIMGPELMQNMIKHTEKWGAEMVYQNATKVDFSETWKKVWDDKGQEYNAKAVIVTSGSKPRTLGIPGEQDFWGKGVSTCATCDGAFYKEKVVAVIGGGDSAMEEATFLTKFAKKVYIIHRREEFRASKVMQERALKNEKIEVLWNTEVKEVNGEGTVNGIKILNNKDKKEATLEVDGFFLAIGQDPNSAFLVDHINLNDSGYAVLQGDVPYTSKDGVFVGGELADHKYKQAITSAGDGCKAAMDAEKWLEANHDMFKS